MKAVMIIAAVLGLGACSVGIPGTSAKVGATIDANGKVTPSGSLGVTLF